MAKKRAHMEQHIAVFGESGSGKTILVSSFYGATQESAHAKHSLFNVVAEDIGQGTRLYKNYLGLKESVVPEATRFAGTSYAFSVRLKNGPNAKPKKASSHDPLRLVWHDYPGEWFEQNVRGDEADRRVETFRDLMGSDVALLLVDGQRLLDAPGEEELYLKSLLTNFSQGLSALQHEILKEGVLLDTFPRIWIIALSKADLLPGVSASKFRDLILSKANHEIDRLKTVIAGFVNSPQALSVGEDFVLLSSAKFDSNKIEVAERVGVELVLPLAVMVPLQRVAKWAKRKLIAGQAAQLLLDSAVGVAVALGGAAALAEVLNKYKGDAKKQAVTKLIGAALFVVSLFGSKLEELLVQSREELQKRREAALAKHDYLKVVLTGFQLDLQQGEQDDILRLSDR